MYFRWGETVLVGVLASVLWLPGVSVATLEPVQGLIQLSTPGHADEWQTLVDPSFVEVGSRIRTGPTGLAYLTFFEGYEVDILPDSLLEVRELDVDSSTGIIAVSFDLFAGSVFNNIENVLDPASRYEIQTPSASIAVRGTHFFVTVTPGGDTTIIVRSGAVTVTGITPDNQLGDTLQVEEGQSLHVPADGSLDPVGEVGVLPEYPPESPLAPETCGNLICEPDEANTCALDCQEFPQCGNGQCNPGEGVVSCPTDCVWMQELPDLNAVAPSENPSDGTYFHFLWATMQCGGDPPNEELHNPLVMYWGIGCFDTEGQTAAHPHPADYQLFVDGQAWDMGGLHQSGPHRHPPYCPWGWNFVMDPVELPPGEHVLKLVETAADTWESTRGGHTVGQTNTLECTVIIQADPRK